MIVVIIIAWILFGIIALVLLIALFVKKTYSIQREIVIDRSKGDVFGYIKYLKNQDQYSYWASIDPDMKRDFKGVDGTPGFTAYWDSPVKQAGKGEQEIIKIEEGSKIDYQIRFIRPFKGISDSTMQTISVSDNSTDVIWSFASEMKYPMNVMLLFLDMEKLIGKDLSIGLENLKKVLESSPARG